jgi:hypothetical protein
MDYGNATLACKIQGGSLLVPDREEDVMYINSLIKNKVVSDPWVALQYKDGIEAPPICKGGFLNISQYYSFIVFNLILIIYLDTADCMATGPWYWYIPWNGNRRPFELTDWQRRINVGQGDPCMYYNSRFNMYDDGLCDFERDVICEVGTNNIPLGKSALI